jgi:hypothetical protein
MYTLLREITLQNLLFQQLPALGLSLVIAELFYKFHSFTLECIAFLVTWYAIDNLIHVINKLWKKQA